MCRRSELQAAPATPDAAELYKPDAARSVERSCGAPEVASPQACLHWKRQAARSPTPAPLEELAQLDAALPGVSEVRPQSMLLKNASAVGGSRPPSVTEKHSAVLDAA